MLIVNGEKYVNAVDRDLEEKQRRLSCHLEIPDPDGGRGIQYLWERLAQFAQYALLFSHG